MTYKAEEQTKVEDYLEKPLITETIITVETPQPKPKQRRTLKTTPQGIEVIGYSKENCVQFAKRITGISRPLGNGARKGINTHTPQVGAIASEKGRIHAVVVESIKEDGIVAIEANFSYGKITRRFIPFSQILGYVI